MSHVLSLTVIIGVTIEEWASLLQSSSPFIAMISNTRRKISLAPASVLLSRVSYYLFMGTLKDILTQSLNTSATHRVDFRPSSTLTHIHYFYICTSVCTCNISGRELHSNHVTRKAILKKFVLWSFSRQSTILFKGDTAGIV